MRSPVLLPLLLTLALAPPATAQIELAAEINPGPGFGPLAQPLAVYDGRLFFMAFDGAARGLWSYDAATDTAAPVNPTGVSLTGTSLGESIVYGGRLFFEAGGALHAYDAATNAVERLARPVTGRPAAFAIYDDRLFTFSETQLFAYDAATDALTPIRPDVHATNGGSASRQLAVYDGKLYFNSFDDPDSVDDVGLELWSYDAATDQVALVEDIWPGDGDGSPFGFEVHDDQLFFNAQNPEVGTELFRLDASGVALVEDFAPGTLSSSPSDLTPYDGDLHFRAVYRGPDADEQLGPELYSLTVAGIQDEADLAPGLGVGSFPDELTVLGDVLYFTAVGDGRGRELWSYSAATESAEIVQDFTPGAEDSAISGLTTYAGTLYFVARTPETGFELYRLGMPVSAEPALPAASFALRLTGPSPFASQTTVRLSAYGHADVAVYDLLGRRVRTLHSGPVSGHADLLLTSEGLAPGLYVIRATGPSVQQALRVIVAD